MPTASRTCGALTASRTSPGNCSPSAKIWSAWRNAAWPASVSTKPRPAGFSKVWPSDLSSSRTCVLTVCTAMPSRAAARAMPPSLATTQK